jgi:hypothetical protein
MTVSRSGRFVPSRALSTAGLGPMLPEAGTGHRAGHVTLSGTAVIGYLHSWVNVSEKILLVPTPLNTSLGIPAIALLRPTHIAHTFG